MQGALPAARIVILFGMALRDRSQVTRGGVLIAQIVLVGVLLLAIFNGEQLQETAWILGGGAIAGVVVLAFWRDEEAESELVDQAFKLAEEAIRREARRLDSRRAEIDKVLLAYAEWMEFPNYDEIHEVDWARPERSAMDAQVADLLDREADRVLARISEGAYWKEGTLQTRIILGELLEFGEAIARIYNPDSRKPLLETNIEELLKSVNRVSLQVILLLEEVPILDVKDWNLRQVAENVRKASKVVKRYEDLQPILEPVRYLWQGSKFLLASNPLVAAGWIAGSKIVGKAGRTIGKRSLDAYLLSLVRQVLGIIAWETASIYDRTSRYRDPEWVYGVELAHLVSRFPLTGDSLRGALRELGKLALRSSYDRIFLYRCVAQHVSPKPERFTQAGILTEDTRRQIAARLQDFFKAHVVDGKEREVASWRKGVGKRLGVSITPVTP